MLTDCKEDMGKTEKLEKAIKRVYCHYMPRVFVSRAVLSLLQHSSEDTQKNSTCVKQQTRMTILEKKYIKIPKISPQGTSSILLRYFPVSYSKTCLTVQEGDLIRSAQLTTIK